MILFLIVGPVWSASSFSGDRVLAGGGPGASGGGGGSGGGRHEEHLQFVRVHSDPTAMPMVKPAIVPPVPVPPVKVPLTPAPQTPPIVAPGQAAGPSGEGTAGAGPGSGGGIGSGVGTGRGSGVGVGTGGGPAKDYPPTPREFFLPPLPPPSDIRPYRLSALFDVDEKGNARLIGFNPSRNRGYNRQLESVLKSLRFRPGVRADGTAVRDTAEIEYDFH